jgi:hypothetical protein
MNAPFVIDQSKAVVETLGFDEGLGRRERVDAIYEKVLHRESELAERERIDRFIDLQEERKINPWPLVAQALMMSNEFLYVD